MGLRPSWVTPQALFAVSTTHGEKYINFSRSPLNSHVGVSLCSNKYVTRLILDRNNLQNIPYAQPETIAQAEVFLAQYTKIIAKPKSGSGCRDIHVITDKAALRALDISKYILEQHITGKEMRYLVLNDKVIAVHRSDYGISVEEDRPLERISYPEVDWNPQSVETSLKITRILGLRFTAIDFMVDASGRQFILEVNTAPGLKWFHAPTSGPSVDVASLFMNSALQYEPQAG